MPTSIAAFLLVLMVVPLICGVDFAFHHRTLRQRPSYLWIAAFLAPWALLILAAGSGVRALLPFAFIGSALVSVLWFIRRSRRR